jgi:hypothetical protein
MVLAALAALLACAAPTFRSAEAQLVCDRDHPGDALQLTAEDSGLLYQVVQVEIASPRAFCVSLAAISPEATAAPLWSGCWAAGLHRFTVDDLKAPPMPGGYGRSLSLVLTSPTKGDPAAIRVEAQIIACVASLPVVSTPDAGPPQVDAGVPLPKGKKP